MCCNLNIEDIFRSMQEAIECWKGELKTTEGTIKPEKYFVYSILFKFNAKDEYSCEKVKDMNKELTVKDHIGIWKTLNG